MSDARRRPSTRCWPLALLLTLAGPAVQASDLNLQVQSGGFTSVTVGPGASVPYDVVGELSDGLNDGLAMFSFDLAFAGGPLVPAAPPSSQPILNFAVPAGLNNPAGFGGTVRAGRLVQVGGAQNTIKSTFAPFPNGTVVTGVAQPGQPVVLAAGTLTAPTQAGVYALTASDVVANVIRQGETGVPFWRVDRASPGTITSLMVHVQAPSPRVRVRRAH